MFRNLSFVGADRLNQEPVDIKETLYNAAISLGALDQATEKLQYIKAQADTIKQLQTFNDIIVKFGMTRELLEFVDHDKNLSSSIPEVPSLEVYLINSNVDTTAASEAVIEKIKEISSKFYEGLKEHVIKYRRFYTGLLNVFGFLKGLEIGLLFLSQADPVIKLIRGSHIAIQVVAAQVLYTSIKKAKSIPHAVKEALALKLPTTSEQKDAYKLKVVDIFKSKAGINIYDLEESAIPTSPGEKPINSLGYTLENIESAISEIKEAADELKKGEFVADRLETLLKSGEARTPIGRDALIFITDIVTKTMKLSVKNLVVSAHQIKTLGHVVSREANEEHTT